MGFIFVKVGLDLDICPNIARGGYLYVFTKILDAKVIRAQIIYWVECWF